MHIFRQIFAEIVFILSGFYGFMRKVFAGQNRTGQQRITDFRNGCRARVT